jgi:arginine/lysine/ornithine decarboxylase
MYDALSCGSDFVIQSSHKTLGSLSQSAMLHVNSNAYNFSRDVTDIDDVGQIIQEIFSLLTTSSPNSLLLASLDAARANFAVNGTELAKLTVSTCQELRDYIRQNLGDFISLLDDSIGVKNSNLYIDPLRLSFKMKYGNSIEVDQWMDENLGITCELNLKNCITYAIPMGATNEYVSQLRDGLTLISSNISNIHTYIETNEVSNNPHDKIKYNDNYEMKRNIPKYSYIYTTIVSDNDVQRIPLSLHTILPDEMISAETVLIFEHSLTHKYTNYNKKYYYNI